MKKPTLRLRQVFEGPTHFKVVKPLGNPIKIAKKGLSPNLMGRLRKFATGAEVTEPVYGTGTTEEQLTQVRRDIENKQPAGVPVEVIKSSSVAQEPIEKLGPGEDITVESTVTPSRAPRMVATTEAQRMGPPAPVAPVMQRAAAPDEEEQLTDLQYANKLIEEEMAKDKPDYKLVEEYFKTFKELVDAEAAKSQPTTVMPAAPVAAAPVVVRRAPGFAPEISGAPGSLQTETPTVTRRGTVVTAPAVAVPAAVPAPAAAPAAAVETAPAPAPAPAAAPAAVVTPATPAPTAPTVPSVVAPAKPGTATPAAPAAIAAAPAAPPAQLTADQLFNKRLGDLGLSRAEYDKMSPLSRMSVQGIVRQAAALEEQSVADEAMVKAEMKAQQDIIDDEKLRLAKIEKRADEARQLQKEILEDMNHLKDPQSYFSSTSTIGQIGTAISLAAGAFASGMTGMPNYAMQIYNNAVEKDLELQKMKRDSLFSRLRDAGHSAESAEEMVRASARLIAGAQAGKLASIAKLPKVKASLSLEQARLVNDAVIGMARAAELEARPGEREQDRELRREEIAARRAAASASAEEKRLAREQREALRQEKIDQEREKRNINVGYDTLELIDKTGGRQIRKELSNRVSALTAAVELDELFKEGGYEIFNVASNKYRGRGLALLPMLIEQYPLGKGFERAISKNAGEFLKEAMAKPQEATSFIKKLFLDRDPGVGVQELRRDFQRSYVNSVSGYVRNPTSPQVKKAIKDQIDIINEQVKAESEAESGGGFTFQTEP